MKIKCLICGDIIESKSTHDLVSCKCESCHIDGGNDFSKILIIFDDGTKILASEEEGYKKKYEEWENNRIMEFAKYESINN